jgi:hypothetical protein
MFQKEVAITPAEGRFPALPGLTPLGQFGLIDVQVQPALGHVQLNFIAILN